MRKLVILTTIVAAVGWAEAATYYVDSEIGQNDPSRNGGPLEPWRTITYALSRVSGENTFMCRGTFEEDVTVKAYEDEPTFVGNAEAVLRGCISSEPYGRYVELRNFRTYGYVGIASMGEMRVENCYFSNPVEQALLVAGRNPWCRVFSSTFENCDSVNRGTMEFGRVEFFDCVVNNCRRGIWVYVDANWTVKRCRFDTVDGTAVSAGGSESGGIMASEFYNCGVGADVGTGYYGCWVSVEDSIFDGNGIGFKASHWCPHPTGGITVNGNEVVRNNGNGIALSGPRIWLRGNVVKNNGGHGVYITEGNPDLGTPGEPGGNTFAGNKSGYDVYNASSENIWAYGNTWDPQSEQEMEGKTWQEVNVTRIYDHWDNPAVGYVMWGGPVGVEPASLGKIKASFKGVPASGQSGPRSAAEVR